MKKEYTDILSYCTLDEVALQKRLLLLPHCLRKVEHCQATYDSKGLQCKHCNPSCAINRLTRAAEELGYGGICVAPGGSLAIQTVEELLPEAILAIACDKELKLGIEMIANMSDNGNDYNPIIEIIPLIKDGCVNTEVDIELALSKIRCITQTNN